MVSKNRLKYLSSLTKKKFRRIEKKFIVEGTRAVLEGLRSPYVCEEIFISDFHSGSTDEIIKIAEQKSIPLQNVSEKEMEKFTETKTPQSVSALFYIKENFHLTEKAPFIALDNIADPGNLGTIIRTCDWFGLKNILLSDKSVELFNPKVIRSTMGSIFHINYEIAEDLSAKINALQAEGYKAVVADLEGTDLRTIGKLSSKTILILGSEAFGPSDEIVDIADYRVKIPGVGSAESLNVAVAGGILMYELFV